MGWRYYCFTTGGLALFLWAVCFAMPLLESPRYLIGKGLDEEAVRVVQELARINGKTPNLTVEQLRVVDQKYKKSSEESMFQEPKDSRYISVALHHVKGLFATPRIALSTALVFMMTCTFHSTSFYETLCDAISLQCCLGSRCHCITCFCHLCESVLVTHYRSNVVSLPNLPKNCDSWSPIWRFLTGHYVSQCERGSIL